jgi:UDP-N-acetylmuramoyl-tripeptide--D-alanyl-D-alanine ligase
MHDLRLTTASAASVLGASRIGPDMAFAGCAIDSRQVQPGQLFVALPGAHTDGHEHVSQARQAGAAAALVNRVVDAELPSIVVRDVPMALGQLSAYWRAHMPARVAGITGSNGKTTVKELLGAMLREIGETLQTRGNLNNDIGVPMTLLRLESEHRYAVVEMGANAAGEIASLAAMARPCAGIITHCGPAHIQGFGSIEGVARAKGELVTALPDDGVAVLNADDPFFGYWRDLAGDRRVVTFGLTHHADVCAMWRGGAESLELTIQTHRGSFEARVRLLGQHNVMNVLAATAAALEMGAHPESVVGALASFSPVRGRLCPVASASGARLIDDSYNANPASLKAAIEILANSEGTRWLVLGDMAELGTDACALHGEAGVQARESGIDRLLTLGQLSANATREFGPGAQHFENVDELLTQLRKQLGIGHTVLVKGSRSMSMERVVRGLEVSNAA